MGPPNPTLSRHISGNSSEDMQAQIDNTLRFLEELMESRPDTNLKSKCGPVTCATMAKNFGADSLLEWFEAANKNGGTTEEMYEKYSGQYKLEYYRNFSSRPPVDGEVYDKIWTEEPMIEFISKLIGSGIYQKGNYDNQLPDIYTGCVQIGLYGVDDEPAHALIVCRNSQGALAIIDLHTHFSTKNEYGPIQGAAYAPEVIITDTVEVIRYFASYNCNYFTILTRDKNKYLDHQQILERRLKDVIYNKELNDQMPAQMKAGKQHLDNYSFWPFAEESGVPAPFIVEGMISTFDCPVDPGSQIVTRQNDIVSIHELAAITPSVLAYPYDAYYYNELGNKLRCIPLVFNINWAEQNSPWPISVKHKASKYIELQQNTHQEVVRKAAISAILNGVDDPHLDLYIGIYSKTITSQQTILEETNYWESVIAKLDQERQALPAEVQAAKAEIKAADDVKKNIMVDKAKALLDDAKARNAKLRLEQAAQIPNNEIEEQERAIYDFCRNLPIASQIPINQIDNAAAARIKAHREIYGNINDLLDMLMLEVRWPPYIPASAEVIYEVYNIYGNAGMSLQDATQRIADHLNNAGNMESLLQILRQT